MPATVEIRRWTGSLAPGPVTKTNINSTNTRANAEDAHTVNGTANPVQVPTGAGTNYSYWVTTRLYASTSPSGTINNIRWYCDGVNAFGTGVDCRVGQVSATNNQDTGYVQATGVTGSGTQLLAANYPGLTPSTPVKPWTSGGSNYISSSPLTVAGSISSPNTGDFGNFVIYQIEVVNGASPGATGSEQWTWAYDET